MSGLSTRDAKVLGFLRRTVTDTHCPTFRQIGEATGLASTSQVSGALESLRIKGWIKHTTYARRSIELSDPLSDKTTQELLSMRQRIDAVLAGRAQ